MTKNVVVAESNASEPTFGALLNDVSYTDYYLLMSMVAILTMALIYFSITALKNIFGKSTATSKKVVQHKQSITQTDDLVEKLFV